MPNTRFYPDDFPSVAAAGTQTIESSIELLEAETRQAALRTVYSRRQLGQQATQLENAGLIVVADYMPLPLVGKKAQTAVDRVIGEFAYFVGATPDERSLDQLQMGSLILQPCGVDMITARSGVGCFHNEGRGYILGGTNWYTQIQQVKKTRTVQRYRWI